MKVTPGCRSRRRQAGGRHCCCRRVAFLLLLHLHLRAQRDVRYGGGGRLNGRGHTAPQTGGSALITEVGRGTILKRQQQVVPLPCFFFHSNGCSRGGGGDNKD